MSSTAALAQIGPDVEKAEQLMAANKFNDALRIVEVAFRKQALGRLAVLKLFELQGICAAQVGQSAKAKTAFQSLLQLEPKRELPKNAKPQAKAAFREAKEWAEEGKGPMEFVAASPLTDEQGKVVQIAAKVKNDALKLARKVRFHLKADGGVWTELDMEVAASFSSAATEANLVEWWAELLGEREAVLATLGSERNPIRNQGKAVSAPEEEKVVATTGPETKTTPSFPDEPVDPVKPEVSSGESVGTLDLTEKPERPGRSSSALKPVAYGLWGAGAVAGGIGVFFGLQSSAARGKVTSAINNAGGGPVQGLTQVEAYQLDKQSQSDALKANLLFGSAAGLAIAGGICFWLGMDSDDPVAVAPMPNGAAVVGTW